jgi:Na+/H+ antiporter NhaC
MSTDHAYGILSLLPPAVAIVLAMLTRRVVLSLLLGIVIGALVISSGRLDQATVLVFEGFLWPAFTDDGHLRVFAFTSLMGAMVGVMARSGSTQAIVQMLVPVARTRRRGQCVTWLAGLIIFFDDYANTLLVGATFRPLADRLKISREKLAYLVDSTAAPVAGLAILSTWVAAEIGYIELGLQDLEFAENPGGGFRMLIASIPYRFYAINALAFVVMVAATGRDFGPMLQAELRRMRALDSGALQGAEDERLKTKRYAWLFAVLPIMVLFVVVLFVLFATGSQAAQQVAPDSSSWFEKFVGGDSYMALMYGSLVGLMTAMLLARGGAGLRWPVVVRSAAKGVRQMLPALVILWFAWALSRMTGAEHLATGDYLGARMAEKITPNLLPTVAFLLASMAAFATGTSWGTMALMIPLSLQTAHEIIRIDQGGVLADDPILLATLGSVLGGAIFGDHCSPISDTTVLASQASGCNHIAHVRTQMPYALLVAAIAVLSGTLPVGYGVPASLMILVGPLVLLTLLTIFGSRTA